MIFWEQRLTEIREQVLLMSGLAERNLGLAMRGLVERNDRLCDTVETEDTQIDQLEVHVDDLVITYMATHGPIAKDCRLMLAASKISSNLERIGDQATTIARRARDLNKEPLLKPLIEIPQMAELGSEMLRDSITALVDGNAELAIEIVARDKSVNDLYKEFARELTVYMIQNPQAITRALNLLTIAKALERVADHCTNIAEEVFYLFRGEDIRHERALKKHAAR